MSVLPFGQSKQQSDRPREFELAFKKKTPGSLDLPGASGFLL
jgi:hypothetical protein